MLYLNVINQYEYDKYINSFYPRKKMQTNNYIVKNACNMM